MAGKHRPKLAVLQIYGHPLAVFTRLLSTGFQ